MATTNNDTVVNSDGALVAAERRQSSSSLYQSQQQPDIAVLYITERIMVLTFPATSTTKRTDDSITSTEETAYRSSLRHVSRMLRTKHGDSYKIFNLSRRRRDLCQYNPYVVEFGWPIHQAPPLERMCALCKDIDGWLNRDAQNIAILHEKPGASRAAMVVAVFMHYCSISASDDQALDRFAMRKFYNEHKMQASQKRYVNYFAGLLSGQIQINSAPIYLYQIVIYGLPPGAKPYLKFYEKMVPVLTTGAYKIQNPVLTARLHPPLALRGDVLVKCCETVLVSSPSAYSCRAASPLSDDWQQWRPILLFACQFNTCALDSRGVTCVSFSARELDLTSSEEAGLDLLYSFDKDFRPVGELATVVDEDNASTLAYRSNSYDRFDRFAEDDAPSAPPPSSDEPHWTGHSPLTNGQHQQQQHQQQHQNEAAADRIDYPGPPQQQATLVRQSSANDTADSGIHSVIDGESSGGGTTASTLENVVVESQAKRAELVDRKTLAKDRSQQDFLGSTMDSISDSAAAIGGGGSTTDAYVNRDRTTESVSSLGQTLDRAAAKLESHRTPNGPLHHTALPTSPTSEYGSAARTPLSATSTAGDPGQIEFPHRPPPLTAPSRRPFSPQQRPVSPSALSTGGQSMSNLTQDGREIDAELVEEGRYDPQSKAFSYVPAKSLEDHFKAPKQQTKLVLKADRPQGHGGGLGGGGEPNAPTPLTDNDLADLETASAVVTQLEPEKRPSRQAPSSNAVPQTPPQARQRKRSTSSTRQVTPLADGIDHLLDPDFYLNFQDQPSDTPSSQHHHQRQAPPETTTRPAPTTPVKKQQPQPPPKPRLANGGGNEMEKGPYLSPEDTAAFDDLVAYGMRHSGEQHQGARSGPSSESRMMAPRNRSSGDWSGIAPPVGDYQKQPPLTIVNKVPPHLDTRRGWEPSKRGAPGAHSDDDTRWDQVFDDFEKKFIKFPEARDRVPGGGVGRGSTSSLYQSPHRPYSTAPPTPILSSRYQHQPRSQPRPIAESVLRALGPDYADDGWVSNRSVASSLPVRPNTAMGFQSGGYDEDMGGHLGPPPSRNPYASSPVAIPDMVKRTRSIPDDYGGVEYGSAPVGGGGYLRARASSSGSGGDWLSRQMEKLRVRREQNDPVLQQRREQERMLLDELRHVHEDRMLKRGRTEADYSVEGVGVRTVEPGSEEDAWQRQQQQQQQQPQHQQLSQSHQPSHHQAPSHLLYRPQSEQHAPPSESYSSPNPYSHQQQQQQPAFYHQSPQPQIHHQPPQQQQQQPQPSLSYFEHFTSGTSGEPNTILLRREIITNPSESPLLAAHPQYSSLSSSGARPKTGGPSGYSPYQPFPYDHHPQQQQFYNGGGQGNSRFQPRPDKPLDFHRLQEVLWDGGNFSHQHSTPNAPSSTTGSMSSRTVSSPRSILKKPKPSPVESQHHYGALATNPMRAQSYQSPSPYSHNGFHDSDSPRVYDLEPMEMEPAEPTPIAPQGYRPETPAFPLRGETPLPYHPFLYSGAELESRTPPVARAHSSGPYGAAGVRSPSPASQYYAQSRRSSLTSLLEPMDVVHHHPVFVKDTSKYWYKPHISREEAIAILRDKPPGTFIIRDSNSFPGAFGLALKVSTPPPGVQAKTNDGSELVRHFLIEPTAKGVKLKGCNNEPIFGSLAALVYQHSTTPLALPSKLLLPEYDPAASSDQIGSAQALLEQGAACNVTYLHSCDTESLTGPEAVRRAVDQALFAAQQKQLTPTSVHFKVSTQGITVTDNTRKLFFRRHYPVNSVTFCGLDPEERRWTVIGGVPVRIFGFVARKIANRTENACHIFAELEPEQPATAIVNFVTKVMMAPLQQHQQQQRLLD